MFDWIRAKMGRPTAKTQIGHRMPPQLMKRNLIAGARVDRLAASWTTQPMTADQVIDRNQRILVARSRQQVMDNPYGRGFLRLCRINIIGSTGILLQAQVKDRQGNLDNEINDAIETAFWEWSKAKNCDVTGRQSLREIEKSIVNTMARDGEYMVKMVGGVDAGPWGFALQVLDPQRCPVDLNEDRLSNGNFIRQGIEFNRYGRPIAYYFLNVDARADTYTYAYSGKKYDRVPADQIIHGFQEDMVGQKRGLPWTATALYRMRNLGGFEESAVVNARVAAGKMGFIQWEEGTGPQYEDDDDIPEIWAEAGVFENLPSGAKIQEWNPQYPNGELAPFAKHMIRGMAAGLGTPYNELAADLENVNFSSIRQGTLDSREYWKDCQELIIEGFMQRVYEAWLQIAVLSGRIRVKGRLLNPAKINAYMDVEFQARRWPWIDPRADITAAEKSKNNMLTSPSAIIREQGKDPQSVWKETARDVATMISTFTAAGIPREEAFLLVMQSMGQKQTQPPVMPDTETEGNENG